jgi:hypothetical protein
MPFIQIVDISFFAEIFAKFFGEVEIYKPLKDEIHKVRAKGAEEDLHRPSY